MPRDERTYITVHDGMPEHPKVEGLSDAAFRALVTLWCYCSRNRTDGRVRAAAWSKRTTPRVRRELFAAGLAQPAEDGDGVDMHDYLEHQRSAAEIDGLRAKRAAAGAKGGRSRAQARTQASASASARRVAKQTASKPVAESETDLREADASRAAPAASDPPDPDSGTAQTLVAEWIDHCTGGRPPGRVVGQVSREVGVMLAEGIPYADVRTGLAAWHSRGLHPSALASVVHEQRTLVDRTAATRSGRAAPGEEMAQTLEIGRRLQAEHDAQRLALEA